MSVDVRRLRDRDDALRLAELVYGTYGLTYHRGFVYDADRMLELNRAGAVTSLLAYDEGRVVGHLATIRPWFEIADPLPEGVGPTVVEVGLSIVLGSERGRQVQGSLALAAVLETAATNPHLRGFYMKCVTNHPYSQRSARRFLGKATAFFPAGVPAWVRGDATDPPGGHPMSTVLLHSVYGEPPAAEVPFPADWADVAAALYAALGLRRRAVPVVTAPLPPGGSRVVTTFDPARRHGTASVRQAGADLVDAVLDRVRWLAGGHMEHVTVLIPLDSAGAAAAVPDLEAGGLFVGGFIPDLEGTDTLVLERVDAAEPPPDQMQVEGDDAVLLRDRVLADWRRSR